MSEHKAPRHRVAEPPAAWLTDTTPPLQGDLPDLNVWLALVMPEHPHHSAARQYWDGMADAMAQGQRLWFCRSTMLGLVREQLGVAVITTALRPLVDWLHLVARPVGRPAVSRTLVLLRAPGRPLSPPASVFRELLTGSTRAR